MDGPLLDRLGGGGNAVVWRATRGSAAEPVALKVLRQTNPGSEPYARFREEIEVLRRLGSRPGVIPLLDANLPPRPNRRQPAWLAVPVATLLTEHVEANWSPELVARSIATVANTLAELKHEHGIHHRDIKPANLYWFNGGATVGDFGLVDYPEKPELTGPGRWVGPMLYLAPELLVDPAGADPGPADVYALAKTLWVLLTRQNVPLPGELNREFAAARVSGFINHARIHQLELLIERCTRHLPGARSSMEGVATELTAWCNPDSENPAVSSFEDLRNRIAPLVAERISAAAARDELIAHSEALMLNMMSRLAGLREELAAIFAPLPVSLGLDGGASNVPSIHREFDHPAHWRYSGVTFSVERPAAEHGQRPVRLYGGCCVFLRDRSESVRLAAGYAIDLAGNEDRAIWSDAHTVIPGSAMELTVVDSLIAGLHANLARAVDALMDVW